MLTSAHGAKAPASVQRAKAFVDDTGVNVLTKCERCGEEKYIVEGQTICEDCKGRTKRKRAK